MEVITTLAAQKSKSVSPRSTSRYLPIELENEGNDEESDDIYSPNKQSHHDQNQNIQPPIPPSLIILSSHAQGKHSNPKISVADDTPVTPIRYNDGFTACSCTFLRNQHNILRLITLLLSLLFIIISGLYAFGQILELQLFDYFCEPKSLDEIYAHSIGNSLNEGTTDGCWTTSSNKIDSDKLFSASSFNAYRSVWNINIGNIVKCVLFMIIALFLIIIFILFFIQTINDCCRFCKNNWFVSSIVYH